MINKLIFINTNKLLWINIEYEFNIVNTIMIYCYLTKWLAIAGEA